MSNQQSDSHNPGNRRRLITALIPLQAGCLTLTLGTAAILLGVWLDLRLGTNPRWTLILLAASAPIALGGVFVLTRRALRKRQSELNSIEPGQEQ